MTKSLELQWSDYRRFPYEELLARREVDSLIGSHGSITQKGLSVALNGHDVDDVARLTYFGTAELADGTVVVPDQALLEASARAASGVGAASRQSTRYSVHGLHEYRGKFNPQVVRAIANILQLRTGSVVLDPFCGSGTTLVEMAHMGIDSLGLDVNPLAVAISKAKLSALRASPRRLSEEATAIQAEVEGLASGLSFDQRWTRDQMIAVAERVGSMQYPSMSIYHGGSRTRFYASSRRFKRL